MLGLRDISLARLTILAAFLFTTSYLAAADIESSNVELNTYPNTDDFSFITSGTTPDNEGQLILEAGASSPLLTGNITLERDATIKFDDGLSRTTAVLLGNPTSRLELGDKTLTLWNNRTGINTMMQTVLNGAFADNTSGVVQAGAYNFDAQINCLSGLR